MTDVYVTQEATLVAFQPQVNVRATQSALLVVIFSSSTKYAVTSFTRYLIVTSKELFISVLKAITLAVPSKDTLITVAKQTELVIYEALRPHELTWLHEVIVKSRRLLITLSRQSAITFEPKHTSISLVNIREISVTNPQYPPELVYPRFPQVPTRVTQSVVLCLIT